MLRTDRLILRPFEDSDLPRFSALNKDPVVMEHFTSPRSPAETAKFMKTANDEIHLRGYGLWALQVGDDGRFIGFTGLHHHEGTSYPFPCIEVGWRLHGDAWGQGYATEAARAAIAHGLDMGVSDVVSFTIPQNSRSTAVMERLGLTHDAADDFDHPKLPKDSPLRHHVLYRLDIDAFTSRHRNDRLYSLIGV
ncbi:MAG: GNAT family N-acetyltransferase [Acidimicrobiia bacterium]